MISVLLPFTDERTLLKESIDSIFCQSFGDWELVLIDNAGDAISGDIAAAACKNDSRCRLFFETQKGIAHALNHGLRQARGVYIARMDADDIAHPERLARQARHLSEHPDTGVIACRTNVMPHAAYNEGFRRFVDWQNSLLTAEEHARNRFIESPVAHPAIMARKELFEAGGSYTCEPVPEDYELFLRWMNAGIRFEKLPEVLLTWRDRENRLSRTHDHYTENAFFDVKARYLAQWWSRQVDPNRPVIVCGGSRHIRERIGKLQAAGIPVSAVTDVTSRTVPDLPFIPTGKLAEHRDAFIINLISKRDVRESIREFLSDNGFRELQDFIMAG